MNPLSIRITPGGRAVERGLSVDRHLATVYEDRLDAEIAMIATLQALEAFAGPRDTLSMVCDALHAYAPDLCAIARDVSAIRELSRTVADRDLTPSEFAAVAALRNQTENQWVRARAGQILIDSARPLRDQHAVCDASEVA